MLRWYPWWQLFDAHAFLDLTTPWEQARMVRWCAQDRTGTGAIVELGTWQGASSQALARGLEDRSEAGPLIHAYDSFEAVDLEARTVGTPPAGVYHDGSSFRPIYERRLGRRMAAVEVHEGDILDAT